MRFAALAAMLPMLFAGSPGRAQETDTARVPFAVGEHLEYDVKFGKLHVGSGSMDVAPMDTVRGQTAWHTIFRISGGIPFYHVHDLYESWFSTADLSSLRYVQNIHEGGYDPKRRFEIYPQRRVYTENDGPTQPSVSHPVDESAFMYYIRTLPLRVGLDTTFSDYFRADRNPVRLRVLRRERIKVPAGEFDAIVVQPIFNAKGLFSEGGHAEIWLSDDASRIMLQMTSKLSIGSINLYLKSARPNPASSR
jgi:hypothetical protein